MFWRKSCCHEEVLQCVGLPLILDEIEHHPGQRMSGVHLDGATQMPGAMVAQTGHGRASLLSMSLSSCVGTCRRPGVLPPCINGGGFEAWFCPCF